MNISLKKTQRGSVLIVSLIILIVLTVVVFSANRGVLIQERATAAIRENNTVFQTAESALIEAEAFIDSLNNLNSFSDVGANGFYSENNGPSDYAADAVWEDGVTQAASTVIEGYSARYFIENLGEFALAGIAQDISLSNDYNQPNVEPVAEVFRIVVRAVGPNGRTEQIIAGYYSSNL